MLEVMLESENVLLVACAEMVKTPMIAAASSWMTVIAYEPPLVAETQWITLERTSRCALERYPLRLSHQRWFIGDDSHP